MQTKNKQIAYYLGRNLKGIYGVYINNIKLTMSASQDDVNCKTPFKPT